MWNKFQRIGKCNLLKKNNKLNNNDDEIVIPKEKKKLEYGFHRNSAIDKIMLDMYSFIIGGNDCEKNILEDLFLEFESVRELGFSP